MASNGLRKPGQFDRPEVHRAANAAVKNGLLVYIDPGNNTITLIDASTGKEVKSGLTPEDVIGLYPDAEVLRRGRWEPKKK